MKLEWYRPNHDISTMSIGDLGQKQTRRSGDKIAVSVESAKLSSRKRAKYPQGAEHVLLVLMCIVHTFRA